MTDSTRVQFSGGILSETRSMTVVDPDGGIITETVVVAFNQGTFRAHPALHFTGRGAFLYEDVLRTVSDEEGGFVSYTGSDGVAAPPPPSGATISSVPPTDSLAAQSATTTSLGGTGAVQHSQTGGTLAVLQNAQVIGAGSVNPALPAGSTVVFYRGVGGSGVGGAHVTKDAHTLVPASGNTYTVTTFPSVSEDKTDDPISEKYDIT